MFIILLVLCENALATTYMAYDQKWDSQICIKNYQIGAAITEDYSDAERLQGTTSVSSFSNRSVRSSEGILEAEMRSNVAEIFMQGGNRLTRLLNPPAVTAVLTRPSMI
jgi:hypothetical protein